MKDEFDNVTPDMFERDAGKKVSKPDLNRKSTFPLTDAAFEEMAKSDAARAERRAARGASSSLDEFNKKVSKPVTSGGSGSGSMGTGKMNRDISKLMKKGGKVSSASSRGDGCAVKGKTKGRFV
jgi:hypothetical protein